MYRATPPKPDEAFNEKYIYLCQTQGCGEDINDFPVSAKNPAPVHCKRCQSKENRKEIEASFAEVTKK